jgi:hypothetical protein
MCVASMVVRQQVHTVFSRRGGFFTCTSPPHVETLKEVSPLKYFVVLVLAICLDIDLQTGIRNLFILTVPMLCLSSHPTSDLLRWSLDETIVWHRQRKRENRCEHESNTTINQHHYHNNSSMVRTPSPNLDEWINHNKQIIDNRPSTQRFSETRDNQSAANLLILIK